MKITFQRLPPKISTYSNYKKCYNHKFGDTLVKELSSTKTWNNDISIFIDIYVRNLDKHESLKKKGARGKHLLFINEELSKAIMHRSKLCNNFLRNRFNENAVEKTIRNNGICVSLLRRTRKNYYSNLNKKNNKFRKTVTPFLSDKVLSTERITLIETDKIFDIDKERVSIINTFSLT